MTHPLCFVCQVDWVWRLETRFWENHILVIVSKGVVAFGVNFVNKVHDFLVFGCGKKRLFVKWRMKRCCTYQKASTDFKMFKYDPITIHHLIKLVVGFSGKLQRLNICVLAKVDVLSFLKKYEPKAPVMDKINATTLLEGFRGLVGQFLPPIRLQIDHST